MLTPASFNAQAVDFNLPTTPTNTAHYAIVPPPTPPARSPRHDAVAITPPSKLGSSSSLSVTRSWRDACAATDPADSDNISDEEPRPSSNKLSNPASSATTEAVERRRCPGATAAAAAAGAAAAAAETAAGDELYRSSSAVGETTMVTGRSLSGASASRVIGDEEGISAKESRCARRAHRSALLSLPESMSPRSRIAASEPMPSRSTPFWEGNSTTATMTSSSRSGGGVYPHSTLPVLSDSPVSFRVALSGAANAVESSGLGNRIGDSKSVSGSEEGEVKQRAAGVGRMDAVVGPAVRVPHTVVTRSSAGQGLGSPRCVLLYVIRCALYFWSPPSFTKYLANSFDKVPDLVSLSHCRRGSLCALFLHTY